MLRVPRNERRFEKLHEALRVTHILGRAASLAVDKRGVVNFGIAIAHLFDDDIVLPVVAEVVDVLKPMDAAVNERPQPNVTRLVLLGFEVGIERKRSIGTAAHHELEQMRIGPAHRDLYWETREVYVVGGRLNPSESLAVAGDSAYGFGWGDGGLGAAQLALPLVLRVTERASADAHDQAFKWEVMARLPQADLTLALSTVRDWVAFRSAS